MQSTHAQNTITQSTHALGSKNKDTPIQDGSAHEQMMLASTALAKMVNVVHKLVETNSNEEIINKNNLTSAMNNTFGVIPNKTSEVNIPSFPSSRIANSPAPVTASIAVKNLPKTDGVFANIRKQILEGKDVNFASLLIPNYDLTCQI